MGDISKIASLSQYRLLTFIDFYQLYCSFSCKLWIIQQLYWEHTWWVVTISGSDIVWISYKMVIHGTSQKRCAKLGSSIIVCLCLLFIDADSHKTPKGEGSVSVFSLFLLALEVLSKNHAWWSFYLRMESFATMLWLK